MKCFSVRLLVISHQTAHMVSSTALLVLQCCCWRRGQTIQPVQLSNLFHKRNCHYQQHHNCSKPAYLPL